MAIRSNLVMGKLSHGGLLNFPKIVQWTRTHKPVPGDITWELTGDSRVDVIALQEVPHTVTEGSNMIPLRMFIISVVFIEIHSVTFWASLSETSIEKEECDTEALWA